MIRIAGLLISVIAAYLLGSIPTSFILTRLFAGTDIRAHGSGNVGATNVLRVVGKLPALATLIIDISKGVLAVTLLAQASYPFIKDIDYELARILLGLSAISGHIWTIFLKFKGGKGVATTIGVLAVLAPSIFIPSILVWLAVFVATNFVSTASLSFGLALPIFALIESKSVYLIIFSVTLCFINSYKHRANILRLIRGEEPKTYIFKSS